MRCIHCLFPVFTCTFVTCDIKYMYLSIKQSSNHLCLCIALVESSIVLCCNINKLTHLLTVCGIVACCMSTGEVLGGECQLHPGAGAHAPLQAVDGCALRPRADRPLRGRRPLHRPRPAAPRHHRLGRGNHSPNAPRCGDHLRTERQRRSEVTTE